jgi:hypothetical protein
MWLLRDSIFVLSSEGKRHFEYAALTQSTWSQRRVRLHKKTEPMRE